jgi:hypothetical protein
MMRAPLAGAGKRIAELPILVAEDSPADARAHQQAKQSKHAQYRHGPNPFREDLNYG